MLWRVIGSALFKVYRFKHQSHLKNTSTATSRWFLTRQGSTVASPSWHTKFAITAVKLLWDALAFRPAHKTVTPLLSLQTTNVRCPGPATGQALWESPVSVPWVGKGWRMYLLQISSLVLFSRWLYTPQSAVSSSLSAWVQPWKEGRGFCSLLHPKILESPESKLTPQRETRIGLAVHRKMVLCTKWPFS